MSSACVARRQDKKKKGSACGTLSTSKSSCPLREEKTHTMVFHATKRTRDTHHMMMHTHAHTHSRRRRGRRGPAREIRRRRNDDWRARVAPRLRDALLLAGMVRVACGRGGGGGGGADHLNLAVIPAVIMATRTRTRMALAPEAVRKEARGGRRSGGGDDIIEAGRRSRGETRRRVQWQDDDGGGRLITVRLIGQSRREAWRERTAENMRETRDLVCRHFDAPLNRGGCAGQWSVLIAKVSALNEPDYSMLGRFWARRFGSDTPRLEEHGGMSMSSATSSGANPAAGYSSSMK